MNHECKGCGATFDTLCALQLHECSEIEVGTSSAQDWNTSSEEDWVERRHQSWNQNRRQRVKHVISDELDNSLTEAKAGNVGSAVTMLAQFEWELKSTLKWDDGGDMYRDMYWGYYEPIAEALDVVARTEGWPFLLGVISTYDPQDSGKIPLIGELITNVIARSLIRTRLSDGIEVVPVDALEYLAAIPQINGEDDQIAWEASMQYGWGIGHPEHPVESTILDYVSVDAIWASGAAIQSLYADQRAAVGLCTDILREIPWEDRPLIIDDLSHLEGEPSWERFPRYWNIEEEFDQDLTFEFDEPVERQLQAVIEELAGFRCNYNSTTDETLSG